MERMSSVRMALLLGIGLHVLACGSSDAGGSPAGTGGGSGGGGGSGNASGGGTGGSSVGPCAGTTPESLVDCVSKDSYVAELTAIAGVRPPGSAHWQEVQDHCAQVLQSLGFTVSKQTATNATNVIATRKGTKRPDEHVVIAAHYDHIPGCTGADDNASGVAGMLEIARVIASRSFERTLDAVCMDREEDGQIGSIAYVRKANNDNEAIAGVFILDSIGYSSDAPNSEYLPAEAAALYPDAMAKVNANQAKGNFIAIVGDSLMHDYAVAIESNSTAIGRLGILIEMNAGQKVDTTYAKSWSSDQLPFWFADYPAVFVNDTPAARNPNYHCKGGEDAISALNHDFATDLIKATVGAVGRALDDKTSPPPRPSPLPCSAICDQAPNATAAQLNCFASILSALSLPVQSTPACADITTVGQCNACATGIGLQAGDCALIGLRCLN